MRITTAVPPELHVFHRLRITTTEDRVGRAESPALTGVSFICGGVISVDWDRRLPP